jgi:hypothetical protein
VIARAFGPRGAAVLGALVAVRLAVPLVALAAEGHDLPGIPRYDHGPLWGDAEGFYAAVREFIAAVPRLGALRLGVLAAGVAAVSVLSRRLRPGWLRIVAPAFAVALAVAAVIDEMGTTGAAVFGWPLVWSIPSFPLRALGLLDEESAFVVGFALSLAANAVTVVATAFLGLHASGRRSVGVGAAAIFAVWPLLTALLAGRRAWENAQWHVDVGLHLYTEPLSTALVTTAVAMLLAPAVTDMRLAAAGLLLGLATAVRLSNGIVAALAVGWVLWRERSAARAAPLAVAGLALAPIVIAFWPLGYVPLYDNPRAFPEEPFSLGYAVRNWTESWIFTPRALALLAPLALLGAWSLRRRPALPLLAGVILVTAAFYSLYELTRQHPRFLYVVLPELFVLEAAGVYALRRLTVRNS